MHPGLACLILLGAGAPSATEILQRTAAVYRKLASYEFRVVAQTIEGAAVSERRFTVTGARPQKFRVQNDDPRAELRIGDGRTEWVFHPETSEYAKAPITATPVSEFEEIDQHVTRASVAREEQFTVDGKPVPVYVVRVSRDRWPPPNTDRAGPRPLQSVSKTPPSAKAARSAASPGC